MKDVSRRDKSMTAGILEKRAEKLFLVQEPYSWLHSGYKGLLFARLRPGSKENVKPKLDSEREKGRRSLCKLSSFVQGW